MRRTLSRRQLCSLAPAAALGAAGAVHAEPERAASPGAVPLALDRQLDLRVESQGIRWREYTYHLVRLNRARFHLDERSRLTAVLTGGLTTFDDVDYDVHVAVFDAVGDLLGTARTACPVERIWLGKVITSRVELKLDFGISHAFANARTFTVAITDRKVLTPDDWQK
jgi:hypothetical protein